MDNATKLIFGFVNIMQILRGSDGFIGLFGEK